MKIASTDIVLSHSGDRAIIAIEETLHYFVCTKQTELAGLSVGEFSEIPAAWAFWWRIGDFLL